MKKIALIIAAVIAATMLCACGKGGKVGGSEAEQGTAQQTQASPVWSEASGKIVVGLPSDAEPMSYIKKNSTDLMGFNVDLINACAEKMGVRAEFNKMNWDNRHIFVNSQNADIILTSPNDDKTPMVFTKPILKNNKVIITHLGNGVSKIGDLDGKTIASCRNDNSIDKLIADYPEVKIGGNIVYDTDINVIEELIKGNVDAAIADEIFVRYYLEKNDCDIAVLHGSAAEDSIAIAASKGNEELIERLQAAVDECIEDGTAHKISTKWFGDDYILGYTQQ